MIRELTEDHREVALDLLSGKPYLNLYLLGNIASMGMSHQISTFWGDFAGEHGDSELRGLLNLYRTGWSIFGNPNADWAALARKIDDHPVDAERLQDNPGGIPSIVPFLQTYEVKHVSDHSLMKLDHDQFAPVASPAGYAVRRATLDDLDGLIEFYANAESMTRSAASVERPLRQLRIWLATRDGEVWSAALTNAETADHAMIGGVFTRPDARNIGLSQAVCSALSAELIEEARTPVLYWDNPAAGVVYSRLGFHEIGRWRALRIQRQDGERTIASS